jgi:RNA polymerase sigma-70 factor (ECF subfamily)
MRATLSDHALIQAYIQGDERAFEILLNRHQQLVFSKILFIVRDEELANDLFQDTFIKAITVIKAGKYRDEGKFVQWLLRVAQNLAIDHFRRNKKMPLVRGTEDFDVFATLQDGDLHVEDRMVQDQILRDVAHLIDLLPPEQAAVVRLRMEADLGFKEIAEETGVSINTALGRMRYALINLRRIVAEQGIVLTAR